MNDRPDKQAAPDHWLARPATIRKLWIGFALVLALLAAADFLIHKHRYVGPDGLVRLLLGFRLHRLRRHGGVRQGARRPDQAAGQLL